VCLKCGYQFLTGEVELGFLEELTELRDVLFDLKNHAKQYSEESKQAQITLKKLFKSLGALNALNVYKDD